MMPRCRYGAVLALLVAILPAACTREEARPASEDATANPASASNDATGARRVLRPAGFPTDRPYSFAVRAGDAVYLAGQLGVDPVTGASVEGIAAQTRQAMENIGAILAAEGLGHQHLVKCHVFLASMDDYATMNEVYGSYFEGRVPARTTVEAAAVPGNSLVEIACIAHADLSAISVVRPPDGTLPAPLGPYSAAVWAGDVLYLSGMGGQDPKDRRVADDVPGQVTGTLANIGTTLTAAGLGFGDVVATTAYVTTPDEMAGFEDAFAAPFPGRRAPAFGPVFLPRLPGPIKVELTFVAARPGVARVQTPLVTAPEAGDIAAQVRAAFAKARHEVEAGGLSWNDVVDVRVLLADLKDMAAMNEVYRETFSQDPPARTTVQVTPQGDALVQIGVTAVGQGSADGTTGRPSGR